VTAYVRHGDATLLAIASWDAQDRTCTFHVRWSELGLAPPRVRAYAPALDALGQLGPVEVPLEANDAHALMLRLRTGGGALLILERRQPAAAAAGELHVNCRGDGSSLLPQCSGLESRMVAPGKAFGEIPASASAVALQLEEEEVADEDPSVRSIESLPGDPVAEEDGDDEAMGDVALIGDPDFEEAL
jgi:hypothetical protein